MVRVVETKVYQYGELSDSAKERARDWFREGGPHDDWWDGVGEQAKEVGKLMGITVDQMYFSGFCSQGDGACFTGSYEYRKGSAKAVRQEYPQDEALHEIVDALQDVQRRYFYGLSASVEHTGRYYHEYSTYITVRRHPDSYSYGEEVPAEVGEAVQDALRDFMRWIYRALEAENDYLNSDEYAAEIIEVNEYEFTESGERFCKCLTVNR